MTFGDIVSTVRNGTTIYLYDDSRGYSNRAAPYLAYKAEPERRSRAFSALLLTAEIESIEPDVLSTGPVIRALLQHGEDESPFEDD